MHDEFAGGTGDGKDNPKQVKTDKVLPAYCNPPNPCPIGYTCKLKKSPIFDFHARKIYVIVFSLMVTEEMFFYTFIIYYTFMILH